jgi:hypothetical protein
VSICVAKTQALRLSISFSVFLLVWSNVLNQIAVLNDCSKEFNEFNRLIFTVIQVFSKLCSLQQLHKDSFIFDNINPVIRRASVTLSNATD